VLLPESDGFTVAETLAVAWQRPVVVDDEVTATS
jgi:hypothetical protein